MRVVLDTNVLISAFLFDGHVGKVLKLTDDGIITPCFVAYTFQEFKNVLNYPKFASVLRSGHITIEEITEAMQIKSIILSDPKTIPSATPDAPNNYVLATAQLAQAEYIVTGDKLLLALKEFAGIPIVTPKTFLGKF